MREELLNIERKYKKEGRKILKKICRVASIFVSIIVSPMKSIMQ